MKKLLAGTAVAAMIATQATAGGMAPVIEMTPMEVHEESQGSSSNLIVPLILLALVFAATGGSSDPSPATSDMRIKTDIVPLGTTANGLPLYHFRYLGSPMVYEGVMAQDVLQQRPEAVVTHANGLMAVDYGMLGLEMKIVD